MRRTTHRVYGLEIETDFGFSTSLESGRGRPDLRLLADAEAAAGLPRDRPPAYASRLKDPQGRPLVELWRQDGSELLSFTGRTAFVIEEGCIRYSAEDDPGVVEGLLLSSVLAYVLERRGVLALHGSAIDIAGVAVCFLAPAGTGKSSLAAAFVAAGHQLLADDVVALAWAEGTWVVRPAFPEIRLRREVGSLLLAADPEPRSAGTPADKHRWRVEPPSAERSGGVALDAVYVLARSDDLERFERRSRLSQLDASIEILKAGFTPNLVEAAGLAGERLDRIGRLVARVPVTRLEYRSELEALPRLVEVILDEISDRRRRGPRPPRREPGDQ